MERVKQWVDGYDLGIRFVDEHIGLLLNILDETVIIISADNGDNQEFYQRALSYRSLCCRIYGESDKYLSIDEEVHPMDKEYWKLYFDEFGYNYHITDAQAAVGIEQLKKLPGLDKRRIQLANRLTKKLQGIKGLTLPYIDPK